MFCLRTENKRIQKIKLSFYELCKTICCKVNTTFKIWFLIGVFMLLIFSSSCSIRPSNEPLVSITFKDNYSGEYDQIVQILETDVLLKIAPTISREGYIFLGWFLNQSGEEAYDLNKTIKEDVTLYAKWEIITHTIEYYMDNQSIIVYGNITQSLNELIPIPSDTEEKTFIGWYDNFELSGEIVNLSMHITQDLVLYPKWDQLIYTINLVTNIPGESSVVLSVPKEAYVSDYISSFKRYGYVLDGWYNDPTFNHPVDISKLKNTNIVIFARWVDTQTEYYISTLGSDNDEGSEDKPFKTFNKAISIMSPGDTIIVYGGIYNEQLIINKSGTEDAWLSFKAYENDVVIIDGTDIITDPDGIWNGMIMVEAKNYIRIIGFMVINSTGAGIFVADSHHIEIINNYTFNNNSPGIFVWSVDDLLIDGNEVEYSNMHPDAGLEDISLRDNKRVVIRNNYVHHSDNIGIDVAGGSQNVLVYNNVVENVGLGIYVDAWDGELFDVFIYDNISRYNDVGLCVNTENGGSVYNVKVFNNLIYDNRDDGMVIGWGGVKDKTLTMSEIHYYGNKIFNNLGDGIVIYAREYSNTDHLFIYNNYIYDNNGGGIIITGLNDLTPYALNDVWIVHNTIVNNGSENTWFSGGIGIGAQENAIGTMKNIYIKNNIIANNFTFSIAVWPYGTQPSNLVINHNLIDGYREAEDIGETKGTDYVELNPDFVDYTNRNLKLSSTSKAIDAGYMLNFIEYDYDQDPRLDGYLDIGADEYVD